MQVSRALLVVGVAAIFLGLNVEILWAQHSPSIEFGGAAVSLGMTVEQVKTNLANSGRRIEFLADKHTAVVRVTSVPVPAGVEGQITFFDGRVVYAAFEFPIARNSEELAQEIAGAVDNITTRSCIVGNYSAHGTGGGFSEVIFDCGPKSFDVITSATLGASERDTNVEITIGSLWQSSKQ